MFKFRLTKEPLPTDGDLLRTITRGVRGTAMPAWYELPLNDRLAVIQYIKYRAGGGPFRSGQALCVLHRGAARPAVVHRQAARCRLSNSRSRQGSVAESRNAGSAMAKAERATARRPPG